MHWTQRQPEISRQSFSKNMGSSHSRLLAIKKKPDPAGLFFVHHGAGNEE
jgi:hypothetical protein